MWQRYQEYLLFLYALANAIFPIPALDVVTLPMIALGNYDILTISLIAMKGFLVGDIIGYGIAYFKGRCILPSLIDENDLVYGEQMMSRYGVWSIFIGSMTTIPAFLLPYLAGLVKMNLLVFLVLNGMARFLKCIVGGYVMLGLRLVLNSEYGWLFFLVSVFLYLISWVIMNTRKKQRQKI